MDISDENFRIVLIFIEDPITMVSIDIDIGNSPDIMISAQLFDDYADVIDCTKASCSIAPGVVQATNRDESSIVLAVKYSSCPVQYASCNDAGGMIV